MTFFAILSGRLYVLCPWTPVCLCISSLHYIKQPGSEAKVDSLFRFPLLFALCKQTKFYTASGGIINTIINCLMAPDGEV